MAKQRKQLHQSGVELAAKCGEAFFQRYIRGIRRPPKSYQVSGTAVDLGVTHDLNTKIHEGALAPEDEVVSAARDYVEQYSYWHEIERESDELGKSDTQLKDETKDKVVRLAAAHHSEIAPSISPLSYPGGPPTDKVKHPFSISLDKFLRTRARERHEEAERFTGWAKRTRTAHATALNAAARQGYDFVGERDIVENLASGGLGIRDTKTSKKSPSADIAAQSHQLSAYALATQVIEGRLPDRLVLDYLIDLKRGPKAVSYPSQRDQADLEIYLNRIEQTVVSVTTGNFAPAPNAAWWCDPRYCGYYSTCRYVRQPSLIQITTDIREIQDD